MKWTAAASSSGRPIRPNCVKTLALRATMSGASSIASGVSMMPGAMQFTRMPEGPYSTAAVCVSEMMPAFVAAYSPHCTQPRMAVIEEMRSEEHTSELQSLMRISYAVFCLKKKKLTNTHQEYT